MMRTGSVLAATLLLSACLYGPTPSATPAAAPATTSAPTSPSSAATAAASAAGATATLHDDAAHPGMTQGWVRTELYFGLGLADHPEQGRSEAQWRAFLDAEVTPRFPSGLSVLDIYGQWQGKEQKTPERLHSKVLVLLHEDSPKARAAIDAIRLAWKQKTGDQSVLRVTQPAEVSF
jgi:hypothetical protein